jgi:cytochrome b561
MVLAGITLTVVRGDSLFNLVRIPSPTPGDKDLAEQIQDIHGTIGWIILAVAGLHAAAALAHRYLWHDGVLARMLPRGR